MSAPVSFVAFNELVSNDAIQINALDPEISDLTAAPAGILPTGVTNGTIIGYSDGRQIAVRGTVAATKAALEGAALVGGISATFSDTGTLLSTTSETDFTGNATVSDTSLFAIPFVGASGSYNAVATIVGDNPNFAVVTLDGAPTHLRVRTWKHDGTKEARSFTVIVQRGSAAP